MSLLLHNLVVIEIISNLEELLHASLKYNHRKIFQKTMDVICLFHHVN